MKSFVERSGREGRHLPGVWVALSWFRKVGGWLQLCCRSRELRLEPPTPAPAFQAVLASRTNGALRGFQ